MSINKELQQLSQVLHGELHYDDLHKNIYATDASVYRKIPLAVAFPKDKNDLKKLISKKLENGENEKQIYEFLVSRYGDWIVYNPGLNFNSLALWLLPLIIFIIGGFFIFRLNK